MAKGALILTCIFGQGIKISFRTQLAIYFPIKEERKEKRGQHVQIINFLAFWYKHAHSTVSVIEMQSKFAWQDKEAKKYGEFCWKINFSYIKERKADQVEARLSSPHCVLTNLNCLKYRYSIVLEDRSIKIDLNLIWARYRTTRIQGLDQLQFNTSFYP